jgi:PadR family transcriptional regulator PadR
MDDTVRKLQRELHAGTTSLVVLALVSRAEEPIYGYSLAKQLEESLDADGGFKPGTVYPVLRSLESLGLLASQVEPSASGPPRRYYSITARGKEALMHWKATWIRTRTMVDVLIEGHHR